jgi:HK97 family phage major capsid protein
MKQIIGSSAIALAAASHVAEFGRKKDGDQDTETKALTGPELKKLTEEVQGALKQVQDFAVKAADTLRKGEELSAEQKAKIDEALTKFNSFDEIKKRIDDIEQKAARGGGENDEARTAGQKFVDSEEFKSFAGQTRPRGRVIVEVKDISSLTTDAAGSVGAMLTPQRIAAPIELPQRRMTVRSLLAPGTTSAQSIEYVKEKGFTNAAAPVAEMAAKPQSDLQFEDATAAVRTIAHWMRASVQILDDAPGLRSIIDQRLRYGLGYVEEGQLLNGSGSGQNLSGLITEATAYSAEFAVDGETQIDKIRLAMLQVALAEYAANGVVLNPIDWAVIETLKDGNGRYLIGNPQGTAQPRLWGLPVVATQAMTEDKFLVGAFDLAAQIFDRQNATVEVSTEDQDNFIKNKVTIRAEERLALAVYRPEAIVYGDMGRLP